jgi:tight adherence protein C
LIVVGALIFGGASLIAFGGSGYLGERQQLLRRLAVGRGPTVDIENGRPGSALLNDDTLKRFTRFVTPKSDRERTAMRAWLIRAGYRNPAAARIYYAYRVGFGLGLTILAAVFVPLLMPKFPIPLLLFPVFGATAIGFMLPTLWIERRIQYRHQAAEHGFPDALDMLLVCIEAGQGLDQALGRLSQEIRAANATLAEEFVIVSDELRAGKERAVVLRDFSERIGVADISAFMTVLKQSDEFGVSIADAVRVYAAEMRNKRIMRAEEKANMLPVKLALGSILFTVPPVMVILAAPSFIMILRSFSGMQP